MSDPIDMTYVWPGIELTIQQHAEWVDTTGLRELNPDWRMVDEAGHGHFVASGDDRLPTLRWMSEPCTMGHGEDCNAEGRYECRICGVEIRPGTREPKPFSMQTHRSYRLKTRDGQRAVTYEFSEDDWDRLQEAITGTVANTLEGREVEVEMTAS